MASVKQNDEKKMADEAEPTSGADEASKASKPLSVEVRQGGGGGSDRGGSGGGTGGGAASRGGGGASGPGFFTIYKKGQGYWTRMGTVGGAALIAILTVVFVHDQVRAYQSERTALIADAVFLIAYSLVVFRIINKPNVVEFLIATDSEMKKVNWTTKAELIGSTKVVILFMFLIMILLFLFDTAFGYFFEFIRVLQFGPFG